GSSDVCSSDLGNVPRAGNDRFQAGRSDEEPEPEGCLQQRDRVGEERGEQPGVLYTNWARFDGVGQSGLSRARAQRREMGGVEGSARLGEDASVEDFRSSDKLSSRLQASGCGLPASTRVTARPAQSPKPEANSVTSSPVRRSLVRASRLVV